MCQLGIRPPWCCLCRCVFGTGCLKLSWLKTQNLLVKSRDCAPCPFCWRPLQHFYLPIDCVKRTLKISVICQLWNWRDIFIVQEDAYCGCKVRPGPVPPCPLGHLFFLVPHITLVKWSVRRHVGTMVQTHNIPYKQWMLLLGIDNVSFESQVLGRHLVPWVPNW